jgi:exopolysaccharide production protein ExoZ
LKISCEGGFLERTAVRSSIQQKRIEFPTYGDHGASDGKKDVASKYFRLQYLRALAALCVVFFHAGHYLNELRGEGEIWSILPGVLGAFGVFLFFVISGYLMATLAQRSVPTLFLAHRIIRIYPIYWIVLLLYFLVSAAIGQYVPFDPQAILLIPGPGHAYALGVEWTLPFEMTFYLIVFLIILLRLQKALTAIAMVWGAGILALAQLHPDLGQDRFPQLLDVPLSRWTLPFLLGLLIPVAIQRGLPARLGLPIGVAFLASMTLIPAQGSLLLAGACFFLVAWAVAPRNPSIDRDRLSFLARFGDWSYAMYLCHVPIIQFILLRCPKYISQYVIFFFSILIVIVISSFIGRLDIFVYRRLKGIIDRSGPRVRKSVAAAFLVVIAVFGVYSEAVVAADKSRLAADDDVGTRLAASPGDIGRGAESLGFKSDGAVRGTIDATALNPGGQIQISGWAFDSADPTRQVSLLFFHDGKYLGAALTDLARPDVDEAFHIHSVFSRRGFSATLRVPNCRPGHAAVILVTTEDGRFASVAPPAQFEACRTSISK